MEIQIAETLFKAIETGLNSTLTTGTGKVMMGAGAAFGSVWMIHFAMKSIQWLYTGMDAILQDVMFSIMKMAFIVYFAFNVTWYLQTVVPFVTELPNWMGGVLSGQEGNQTNQVDTLINAFIEAVKNLVEAMNFDFFDNFSIVMLGICVLLFVLIGGIPFIAVCVGTLITLKVATTVLLCVGPVFIAFALFDQSRQWFWGWVSTIAGFMFTNILFSVVIALELGFINSVVLKNGAIETTWTEAFAILFYFGAFTMLAVELPGYAASVMGGTPSGGVTGVGGILGKVSGAGSAMKMTGAAGKAIGKRLTRLRNSIR
ncbi:type IV secretion system protein [Serratia proteamaculans]|uniref:type IV secretion system protein n=1 Tax=Serratia proteamaculans TaxID=28151 RepID=UPI003D0055CF